MRLKKCGVKVAGVASVWSGTNLLDSPIKKEKLLIKFVCKQQACVYRYMYACTASVSGGKFAVVQWKKFCVCKHR